MSVTDQQAPALFSRCPPPPLQLLLVCSFKRLQARVTLPPRPSRGCPPGNKTWKIMTPNTRSRELSHAPLKAQKTQPPPSARTLPEDTRQPAPHTTFPPLSGTSNQAPPSAVLLPPSSDLLEKGGTTDTFQIPNNVSNHPRFSPLSGFFFSLFGTKWPFGDFCTPLPAGGTK